MLFYAYSSFKNILSKSQNKNKTAKKTKKNQLSLSFSKKDEKFPLTVPFIVTRILIAHLHHVPFVSFIFIKVIKKRRFIFFEIRMVFFVFYYYVIVRIFIYLLLIL
jgi:hypothetical protein